MDILIKQVYCQIYQFNLKEAKWILKKIIKKFSYNLNSSNYENFFQADYIVIKILNKIKILVKTTEDD